MITIRKATWDDAPSIATYLLLAMKEIVYQFIGKEDPEEAQSFLLYFVQQENNQYSWQNCWVAAVGTEVIAAVNVYDGAGLQELRAPVLQYLQSHHRSDFVPEDETGPGEYYLDSLGVDPKEQGKGIGSKLLAFIVDEYVHKQGKTIGLLVEEENGKAKRLYLKSGFSVAGKRILFGKKMEHLQIKPVG